MGISLHGGSVGQPGVGSSTGDFERWLKGALQVGHLSLYGSSVKGTWREGSLAGDPAVRGHSIRPTWREGSFTGDPKRYVKALEWASP